MNQEEREFLEKAFLAAKEENEQLGGLAFPFLVTKNWKFPKVIRAIVIFSKKRQQPCFACLGYKKLYNGVFFSYTPEDDEKDKELVEVFNYRVRADIELVTENDRWFLKVAPNKEALERFFDEQEAIYVTNKANLVDEGLPF